MVIRDISSAVKFFLAFAIALFPLAAEELALYYSPRCPSSQKVLHYLKDENIKIPLKDVTASPEAKEELETYGGHLVVPCLMVDWKPIYNAGDIIDWLKQHKVDKWK